MANDDTVEVEAEILKQTDKACLLKSTYTLMESWVAKYLLLNYEDLALEHGGTLEEGTLYHFEMAEWVAGGRQLI